MRYELSRRLATIVRTLAELGEADNSRALGRRLAEGFDAAIAWLRGEHGEHVWTEIGAVASFAKRYANHLPSDQGTAARMLEHAWSEAECLLADALPRPALVPDELRPTVRANVVYLHVPKRAA